MTENRIGRRVGLDVPALWIPAAPLRREAGWRRRFLEQEAVCVVDLSVTGAGVLGPAHRELRVGVKMRMHFAHGNALVRIHRVQVLDDGTARYGTSILNMDDRLQAAIHRAVGGRELVDWRWTVNR